METHPCLCKTHLENETEYITNRPREIANYLTIIKNAESMIAWLEGEEADPSNKEPKPCLCRREGCPCKKLLDVTCKSSDIVVESTQQNEKRN
jgi:hypothetical protein